MILPDTNICNNTNSKHFHTHMISHYTFLDCTHSHHISSDNFYKVILSSCFKRWSGYCDVHTFFHII